jgi:hypothetical protein
MKPWFMLVRLYRFVTPSAGSSSPGIGPTADDCTTIHVFARFSCELEFNNNGDTREAVLPFYPTCQCPQLVSDFLENGLRCQVVAQDFRHQSAVLLTEIVVRPNLKTSSVEERDRALDLLKRVEKLCLVSRAIGTPLKFEPQLELIKAVPSA